MWLMAAVKTVLERERSRLRAASILSMKLPSFVWLDEAAADSLNGKVCVPAEGGPKGAEKWVGCVGKSEPGRP